jgi:hypothetical protein
MPFVDGVGFDESRAGVVHSRRILATVGNPGHGCPELVARYQQGRRTLMLGQSWVD